MVLQIAFYMIFCKAESVKEALRYRFAIRGWEGVVKGYGIPPIKGSASTLSVNQAIADSSVVAFDLREHGLKHVDEQPDIREYPVGSPDTTKVTPPFATLVHPQPSRHVESAHAATHFSLQPFNSARQTRLFPSL